MMMGGLGMGLGILFVIGLPLLLLFSGGAVVVLYLMNKPAPQPVVQRNLRQIIDIRLANGEINTEEHAVLLQRLETERGAS